MTGSLRPHGGLTPGREGKGREQGRGREDVGLAFIIKRRFRIAREAVGR